MQINPHQLINLNQNVPEKKLPTSNNQPPVTSTDTVTISSSAFTKNETAKEIMKDYDLKNISYSSLEEMGSKLRDSGIITDDEFLIVLVPPYAALPGNAAQILEGATQESHSTKSHNMINHFEKMLEMQKESNKNDQKSIETAQQRVDLVHYLSELV